MFTIRTSREQSEIIKSQFKVTAMVVSGEDITLRLVSEEKPFPEALVSEPTMEDAYMYLLGGEANHVS